MFTGMFVVVLIGVAPAMQVGVLWSGKTVESRLYLLCWIHGQPKFKDTRHVEERDSVQNEIELSIFGVSKESRDGVRDHLHDVSFIHRPCNLELRVSDLPPLGEMNFLVVEKYKALS